jgi:probable LLM family oxidoreductase
MTIELGLDTFGDVTNAPDGTPHTHAQVIREVIDQAVLADEVGVDFIGLGEHHRPDFAISSPDTILAAIASRTKRIKLGTAVTVLSSDDPVRVFQRFSTINAISNGRAEVILGRGSFTESFPLFGYSMEDYETLFEDKLSLFSALLINDRTGEPMRWQGVTRDPLTVPRVYPPTEGGKLSAWVGVGGSPESVVRAAKYAFPLTIAIIGGDPRRFKPFIRLYYESLEKLKRPQLPVGIHSPGFIADTDAKARELLWAPYKAMRDRIGRERGWPPMAHNEFEMEIEHGSLYVGSPETVAKKMAATMKDLGVNRFDLKYSAGPLAHEHLMRAIELYGKEVIPRVRELLTAPA